MKRIAFLLYSLLFLLIADGCAVEKDSVQVSEPAFINESELVIGVVSDIDTLDPAVTMDNAAWKITYPCYDRLVQYDGGGTDIIPMAAKEWSISSDGHVYTFYLREDIYFNDGNNLTADAVEFSLMRVLQIDEGPSGYFRSIEGIEVVDEYTVKITLMEPFPPFLSTLATNGASIINPRVMDYEKDGDLGRDYLSQNTMGSGPYLLHDRESNSFILKSSSGEYWGGAPTLDKIRLEIVHDPTDRTHLLKEEKLDIAEGILPEQVSELVGGQGINILENVSMGVNYVYINNTVKPLNDILVRQALNYAVDKQGLIREVMQGYGVEIKNPVPDGLLGLSPEHPGYDYNPELARELLSVAGYEDGFTVGLLYSNYRPYWENKAELIRDNLAQVGITVVLEFQEWPVLRKMVDEGEFDLCVGYWSPDYADPHMFLNFWYDSEKFGLKGNRAFYRNDQVDELLREAGSIVDKEMRAEIYREVQNIVLEEAPYIILFQEQSILAMRDHVKGYVYNPMLENMYNFATMSKN